MSQSDLAQALARLDEHHKLHLPPRRRDLLGRLALRFLWKRNLKWQLETNIATRDAVQTIQHIVQDIEGTLQYLRSKLEPIADSIGDGTGVTMNAGIGPELEVLRRSDQNILAGLNQRFYATVGRIQTELGELRLRLEDRREQAGELEQRLKEVEEGLTRLATTARDLRFRQSHLDLYLDGTRSETPSRPPAVADRGLLLELSLSDLLDGPSELVRSRRDAYLPVVETARGEQRTGEVLDMAPARGDWLLALRAAGVTARSASPNPYVVRHCATFGIAVAEQDPLDVLAAADRQSLAAITAFRYVERINPPAMMRFVDLAATALRPAGALVVETPTAGPDFHLDPFAAKPVHPDLLRFVVEAAGFRTVEIRYVDDGPLAAWPAEVSASSAARADRYCLIAWR